MKQKTHPTRHFVGSPNHTSPSPSSELGLSSEFHRLKPNLRFKIKFVVGWSFNSFNFSKPVFFWGGQGGLLNILPIWACLSQCSTVEGTCIGGPGQARPASEAGIQLTCRLLSAHTLLAPWQAWVAKTLTLKNPGKGTLEKMERHFTSLSRLSSKFQQKCSRSPAWWSSTCLETVSKRFRDRFRS